MSKLKYTEEEKQTALYALANNRWNVSKTSKEMDIPRPTLTRWRDELDGEARADLTDRLKEDIAPLISRILQKALLRLEEEVPNLPKNILPTTCGILFDKQQILRGEPTSVTKQVASDADTLDAELRKLSKQVGEVPVRQ